MERFKCKGMKLSIKSLDGSKVKNTNPGGGKNSFEASVVWKHPGLVAL